MTREFERKYVIQKLEKDERKDGKKNFFFNVFWMKKKKNKIFI